MYNARNPRRYATYRIQYAQSIRATSGMNTIRATIPITKYAYPMSIYRCNVPNGDEVAKFGHVQNKAQINAFPYMEPIP